MRSFLSLNFEHDFRTLPTEFYSDVSPQGLDKPELVAVSSSCAQCLGLDAESLSTPEALAVLSANQALSGFKPLAMKYTGHQFGYYNPDLGDGRGLLLADIKTDDNIRWDLHLKGAGFTPYSRQGDGRAVLRSSIREFLGSEAMSALGIPTTRALCVVNSRTPVYRETPETGATILRVAQSHLRFGHFEYAYHADSHSGQTSLLRSLCDYAIQRHYPCLQGMPNRYNDFFRITAQKTASMIAKWQAAGFAHGVMNTDNMSILGETFDYGPFGFLDRFQPGYICNHSDNQGRYAYDRQPSVAHWNLSVLAQALSPLVDNEALAEGLQCFNQYFNQSYLSLMSAKLGFEGESSGDEQLIYKVLNMMSENQLDYSFFFRHLSKVAQPEIRIKLRDLCIDRDAFDRCLDLLRIRWEAGTQSDIQRTLSMDAVNPKYILRNHLAQNAIELAEQGDYSEVQALADLLQKPFDEQSEFDHYADLPPDWAEQLEISCSS